MQRLKTDETGLAGGCVRQSVAQTNKFFSAGSARCCSSISALVELGAVVWP